MVIPRVDTAPCGKPGSGYTIDDLVSRSHRTTSNGCNFSKFINRHQILYSHLFLIIR